MGGAGDSGAEALIEAALELLRTHLGGDVAFVAQLLGDRRVFRYVAGPPDPVVAGTSVPAEDSYCQHIVGGRLPQVLRDAAQDPVAGALRATRDLRVGSHLGVPIVLSDGDVYGMLGCMRHAPHATWGPAELGVVRMLAAILGPHVEAAETERLRLEQRRRRVRALAEAADLELHLVFQPIVSLAEGRIVGVEALARFPDLGDDVPRVFADARHLGVGLELELRAVSAGLEVLARLPDDVYLAVNAGPATITSSEFIDLMRATHAGRVVVEITEHDVVEDYGLLTSAIDELTGLGVRLAIDDVGTGISGLDHILRLSPHTLKIDGALIEGIDASPAKQAMITALLSFAGRVSSTLVAEHVETAAELETLLALGVAFGQGYHLGRPGLLPLAADGASTRRGQTAGTGGTA
jgi:EAL domain-containing protein (putative c-di-GMP-specific phosphodiesterase class I)